MKFLWLVLLSCCPLLIFFFSQNSIRSIRTLVFEEQARREKFVNFFFPRSCSDFEWSITGNTTYRQQKRGRVYSRTTQLIHVVNFRPFVSQNTTTMSCDIFMVCIRWLILSTYFAGKNTHSVILRIISGGLKYLTQLFEGP